MKHQKRRGAYAKTAVRGRAVRLTPRAIESQPEIQPVAPPKPLGDMLEEVEPNEQSASRVMLVITACGLAFIGFIAWCVTQMPAK